MEKSILEFRITIRSDKHAQEIYVDCYDIAIDIYRMISNKVLWRKSPLFEITLEAKTKSTPWTTIARNLISTNKKSTNYTLN